MNWDNKFSQSRTGYLSLAVNVLRSTPTIYPITKGYIWQIRFSQSNEKIWWKCPHADFAKVWDPLTCWLSRGVLKRYFLESCLTKSFIVCNFRNKVAMTILFISKCLKSDVNSINGTKEWIKAFGFQDNCIWIGDDKFSQSRRGYLWLAVNMLQKTPKN